MWLWRQKGVSTQVPDPDPSMQGTPSAQSLPSLQALQSQGLAPQLYFSATRKGALNVTKSVLAAPLAGAAGFPERPSSEFGVNPVH